MPSFTLPDSASADLQQLLAQMQTQLGPLGVPVEFVPTCAATERMTWTVPARQVTTCFYAPLGGPLVQFSFVFSATTVGGTVSYGLKMRLPNNWKAAYTKVALISYDNGGVMAAGTAVAVQGSSWLTFYLPSAANWTAGAATVQGEISVPVTR